MWGISCCKKDNGLRHKQQEDNVTGWFQHEDEMMAEAAEDIVVVPFKERAKFTDQDVGNYKELWSMNGCRVIGKAQGRGF